MSKITAVGFDMDYTLAMYHSEQFENLSATNALYKLVHNLGYPRPLLALKYDHSKFIRGLVVDKHAGNIIKLDRHKYVKRAVHGDTPLSKDERAAMYDVITHSGGGFNEPRFAVLDAMFALPDAFLFASVVAYKDAHPDEIPQSYEVIYKDVRRSVDMCHRDGSIKDKVAEEPARYIQRDSRLMPMLRKLRLSGRKVFLLTNSLWNYTDVVMKFLHDDGAQQEGHWIDLFDVIITGSAKPAFMLNTRLPIYRCDPDTGVLENTDGVYNETPEQYLARGKCFQGGNYQHLHDLLAVENGTQVLYVGDHIFSDVLRSKRTLGWRTMLVVPELENEVNLLYAPDSIELAEEIAALTGARDELDEWVDRMESTMMDLSKQADAALNGNANSDGNGVGVTESSKRLAELKTELEAARTAREDVRAKIVAMVETYHRMFHPVWGQLFKTGLQNSRFAEQVESYACLYTSKVSNIDLVSPETHWRAMNDLMPHDRLTVAPMHRVLAKRANIHGLVEEDNVQPTQ